METLNGQVKQTEQVTVVSIATPQLPETTDGHTIQQKESPPLLAAKGACGAGFDICGFDLGCGCC